MLVKGFDSFVGSLIKANKWLLVELSYRISPLVYVKTHLSIKSVFEYPILDNRITLRRSSWKIESQVALLAKAE